MIRKLVFSLVLAALLLSSPAALVAQGGPALLDVSLATDSGATGSGGGLDHIAAKRTADADPNGEAEKLASVPTFDLFGWLGLFLSSVFPV